MRSWPDGSGKPFDACKGPLRSLPELHFLETDSQKGTRANGRISEQVSEVNQEFIPAGFAEKVSGQSPEGDAPLGVKLEKERTI